MTIIDKYEKLAKKFGYFMTDDEFDIEAKRLGVKIKSYTFFNLVFRCKKLLNYINDMYNPLSKYNKKLRKRIRDIAKQKRQNEINNAFNERDDDGEYFYYFNEKGFHRVDGPAMQHKTNKKLDRYFLNGIEYSFEDYKTSYLVKETK